MRILSCAKLVGIGVVVGMLAACEGEPFIAPVSEAPPLLSAGTFECGVEFTAITFFTDSQLAEFEVPDMTDTTRVCETWTGSDYKVRIDMIGSSEPATDYSEEMTTVLYLDGRMHAYDSLGQPIELDTDVGATAFEMVNATTDERQASYDEPYYGVMEPAVPDDGCGGGCAMASVHGAGEGAVVLPVLKRRGLASRLRGLAEVGRSPEGFRRFHGVRAGVEETVDIEEGTELVRRMITQGAGARTETRLEWRLQGTKYIRHRMEIDGEDIVDGRPYGSRVVVVLEDVQWNPGLGR